MPPNADGALLIFMLRPECAKNKDVDEVCEEVFIFKKIGQGIILMSTIVCAWIQSMIPSLSNECI